MSKTSRSKRSSQWAQSLRVVQAQVLDVEHRQAIRLEDLHHLAQRRRVGARKDALFDPRVHRLGLVAADAVDQPTPALGKAAVDEPSQTAIVVAPDVLEHAHRHEDVVLALDVAVVVLDVLDAPVEPLFLRLRARVADLLARDVVRAHRHPVVPRHVAGEAAPAAAGLDHAIAGPQLQLAADVVHLRALRLLERHAGLGIVGAGVLHRVVVEPPLVELVAEIVVVRDVVARTGERVAPWAGQESLHVPQSAGDGGGRAAPVGRLEHADEVAFDVDSAETVQVAEMQVGIQAQFPQRPAIAHMDPSDAARRVEADLFAVPEHHGHRALAGKAEDLTGEEALDGVDGALGHVRDVGIESEGSRFAVLHGRTLSDHVIRKS